MKRVKKRPILSVLESMTAKQHIFGTMDTGVLDGMRVYYTKKHAGINGITPAQASLIEVDGKNKWKTIIQNASRHRENLV